MDSLTEEANETQSVNTIYLKNEKVIGHNTDIAGFELGIRSYGYDIKKKKCFYIWCWRRGSFNNSCIKKNGCIKNFFI